MRVRLITVFACLVLATSIAQGANMTFSGYFNDSSNAALVSSDLTPSVFSSDDEIANNVALYPLSVPIAGNVTFESKGFAAGGADPYFTLFQGSDTSATFRASNYDQAFTTGGDFLISLVLSAGDYKVAMGVFANMSLAENYGSGTLADGFAFLGAPEYLGNYYYELGITTPDQPGPAVPEPSTMLLVGAGLAGLVVLRKRPRE